MSKLLFPLRNVPDEEAQQIRDLLTAKRFDWYETSAGNWGISLPALWIKDDTQWHDARECIEQFQLELSQNSRREYEQLKQAGMEETVFSLFRRNPFLYLLAIAGTALIIYFSVAPFLSAF